MEDFTSEYNYIRIYGKEIPRFKASSKLELNSSSKVTN